MIVCPEASFVALGERPAEEEESLVGERVHERRVLAHDRLFGDSAPEPPGRSMGPIGRWESCGSKA